MMNFLKPPFTVIFLFIICVASYFAIFLNLENLPIRVWDEARLAINAVEMSTSGNWIVTTFDGAPDMWNTKPPLMIWLQVLGIKAFGIGELAIRLPSALAALATVFLLFFFCLRAFKTPYPGFFSVLVLITSLGYITVHGTRTGDYDSLLTFFTTAYLLSFFVWTETAKRSFLLLFFVSITLAALTKGVAALMFLPALALYALYSRKFVAVLKQPVTYIGVCAFVVFVLGYYFLREHDNPGYLKALADNELGGRYLETQGKGAPESFWHYFDNIFTFNRYVYWIGFLIAAIIFSPKTKKTLIGRLNVFLIIAIISFFLIISFGQTKCTWYDTPLYPLMALLIGVFLCHWVLIFVERYCSGSEKAMATIVLVLGFTLFQLPYANMISTVYKPKESIYDPGVFTAPYYMRGLIRSGADLSNTWYISSIYDPQIKFYTHVLNKNHQHINFCRVEDIRVGEKVIVTEDVVIHQVENKYEVDTLAKDVNMAVFKVKGFRNGEN